MSSPILKGVVLGEGRVGKTSILKRYFNQKFDSGEASTINPAFYPKKVTLSDETKVEINFWDTAGQEMFSSLNKNYYQGAIAALLVYDVNLPETFEKVKDWVHTLREIVGKNIIFVIAGNKLDLLDKSLQDKNSSQVNEYVARENCKIFYTSCKTGYNVKEVFDTLIDIVLKYACDNNIVINKRGGKKLEIKEQVKPVAKKGCC